MKRIMAAAFEWRTLIWLGIGLVASAALSNPFPAVIALGVYLWAVKRLAASPEFEAAAERVRIAEGLAEKYRKMQETSRQVMGGLPAKVSAGQTRSWVARATDVMTAARSIYHEWLADPARNQAKSPVVEDALEMGYVYLRILDAYVRLYFGQKPVDLEAVRERIARNQQKLDASRDLEARRLLAQSIEMDMRVLRQEEDEETEKERYQAKLVAIESAMDLLRRQVFNPEQSMDGLNVREMLLEAQAMDEALTEVQTQSRIRTRA